MKKLAIGSFVSFGLLFWLNKPAAQASSQNKNTPDRRLVYELIDDQSSGKVPAPSKERVRFTTRPDWTQLGQPEPDLNTLKQVLFIHRHGDRTPINFPPKDPLKDDPIWKFYGGGQITNRGKARLALLGQLIRDRYDNFLGNSVNKNIRVSRSSGSLRCLESAQVFLASFLGLDRPELHPDANQLVWNESQPLARLWQPAHIQSMPAKLDALLAEGSVCENLEFEYTEKINKTEEARALFDEFKEEVALLKRLLGYKMEHFREFFWASSQIEVDSSYFPDKVNPELVAAFPRIEEAGHRAMTLYQSTVPARRYRAGVLIGHMISQMKAVKENGDNPLKPFESNLKPFVHYSSHDLNLVVLLGIFENWERFKKRPNYASNILLELHRDKPNDEWFIKIFYMPKVPHELIELHIPSCESGHPRSRCTLDKFEKVMATYAIPSWQKWFTQCNNNIDSVDPYEPGA